MTAAIKNATKYFPKKRGLINAFVGSFGGNLGSSIFNLIIKFYVSKGDFPRSDDNDMYTKSTAENYKIFFYIHGGLTLGFAIISSLLLVVFKDNNDINEQNLIEENVILENVENEESEENEEKKQKKDIKKKNENDKINKQNYKSELKQIFKHHQIYLILIIYLLTSFLQGFIFTVGFNYGTMSHNGDSDNTNNNKINPDNMSIIFMLCSLISSLMGPLFGLIYDKLYFKYTMIIIDVISALNGLLINLTVKWGVYYYAVSIILNGCLNSGAFSMIFPHVSKIYGFNYAGELYGFTVLSTGISSMISSTVYYIISHFSDKKNDGPYLYIFVIGAVCNILAGIFTFFDSDKNFEFECISNNKEGG